MKVKISVFSLLLLLMFSACSRGGSQHADVNFNYMFTNGNHSVKVEPGRVVITNDEGHQAVITQQGTLTIEGNSVVVKPQVKSNLIQYVQTTQQIRQQGIDIAKHAGSFAMGIVGDVLGGLFSGKSDQDIDRNVHHSAAQFKKSVLPICESLQTLIKVQDAVAAEVPAFRPYKVIKDNGASDCIKDVNSKD